MVPLLIITDLIFNLVKNFIIYIIYVSPIDQEHSKETAYSLISLFEKKSPMLGTREAQRTNRVLQMTCTGERCEFMNVSSKLDYCTGTEMQIYRRTPYPALMQSSAFNPASVILFSVERTNKYFIVTVRYSV